MQLVWKGPPPIGWKPGSTERSPPRVQSPRRKKSYENNGTPVLESLDVLLLSTAVESAKRIVARPDAGSTTYTGLWLEASLGSLRAPVARMAPTVPLGNR